MLGISGTGKFEPSSLLLSSTSPTFMMMSVSTFESPLLSCNSPDGKFSGMFPINFLLPTLSETTSEQTMSLDVPSMVLRIMIWVEPKFKLILFFYNINK